MSDFWLYFKLGLEHVLDWKAYDHLLFLITICLAYSFNSWKRLLLLVTMFTLGHTFSLLLANYEVVNVSSRWIEFLIPVTILTAALFTIFKAGKVERSEKMGILYLITVFFGLIHGFGFAGYYKMINSDGDLLPLLEFALGIEVAQITIALAVLILSYVAQNFFRFNRRDWVLVIASVVVGMVIPMLIDKWVF
jgi:hypothetical protein